MFILALLLSLLVIACVQTRAPQLMAMKQANDGTLTCDQLAVEYKTNTEVATKKIATNKTADVHDFWVGFLVWPGLADFQNADGNEGNALLDRNVYLLELAKDKKCTVDTWPAQPERYT